MFATPEKFLASQKAAVESVFSVANAVFAGTERLVALNLNTARTALEDSLNATQDLLSIKDFQDLSALPASLAQPAADKLVAYTRSVYEIHTQTAEELLALAEAQRAEANKAVFAAIDTLAKNAPAGSEVAFSAVKSAVAAANSAYDNASKAVRQVAEAAEANVLAATNATIKAAKPAAKSKKAA